MKGELQHRKLVCLAPSPHSPYLVISWSCRGKKKWGEEGSLYSKVRGLCPYKPRAFFVSYLHVEVAHRGLLMELVGSNYKSRGMKEKEDNGWFL